MEDAVTLYLPNGSTHKAETQRLGFGLHTITGRDLKGATPNRHYAQWRNLYDMYNRHPTVFSAINKIVKVATNTGYDFVPRDSRKKMKQAEYRKCRDFFATQTDFIGQLRRIYQDLLIFGNAYFNVVYDKKKRPVRLKRVAPWTMHIKAAKNGEVQFYVQRDPNDPGADPVAFQPNEILHFKLPDPADDIYGLSPLEAIKLTVTTDLNAMAWNKAYFQNGAATGTVIVVEEASEAEVERAQQQFNKMYSGATNAHKPVVLTGKVDIKKSVVSHAEMGFLEGRKQLMMEILSVLDVPPAKIGIMETANRSNSKEQDKSFRTESVTPLQFAVESVLSDWFLRDIIGVKDTLFRHSKADTRDAMEQMDLWAKGTTHGFYNINEVRAELGYAAIDGGDINFVMTPTGAVPVVDLELFFQLPHMNEIPEDMHDGHGHADGPGPGTSGPQQKPTANVETGQGSNQKHVARRLWVQAKKLHAEHDDERLADARDDFYRAMKSSDADEALAYLESGYAHWQMFRADEGDLDERV